MSKFKAGDRVEFKTKDASYCRLNDLTVGKTYLVKRTRDDNDGDRQLVYMINDCGGERSAFAGRLNHVVSCGIRAAREARKEAKVARKQKGRDRREAMEKANVAKQFQPKPLKSVTVDTSDLYAVVAAYLKDHHGIDRKVTRVIGRTPGYAEVHLA